MIQKNFLKSNSEKYYLLLSIDKNNSLRVVKFSITNNKCDKLLRMKIDSQLSF